MAFLGKIDLEKEAPDHPFVRGTIVFMPKPSTDLSAEKCLIAAAGKHIAAGSEEQEPDEGNSSR